MARIADVVELKTGYANFVHLKSAFEAAQENTDRMAMYRPTKAHRQAFERICRGLYQPTDKKFYLLSGSYGTGKSHLCLMTANFLSRSSGDPEIAGFYENYERLDPEQARMLRNVRKDGQYLVAICDYHAGRNFEDVVMKAIFEACAARGLDAGVDTEFDEAERILARWEEEGDRGIRNFYADFARALETAAPGVSAAQLRAGLREYDSKMLERFRAAYRESMGGVEFQPQSGNLIPIVRKLVRGEAFKKRFKGLAIFFDEFGETLERSAYSKGILQGFMETICKNEPNVLFIGCIHRDFKAYADRFSQDDAAVMSARITQVDLLNEGIEEIIGAIVETDKACEAWREEVAPKTGVFDQLVPACRTLDLFPWIEDPDRIRRRVLEDIYGVHPMALSCLLKLSSEIGSDARSTFTFFSGDVGGAEGSYAEFIEGAPIAVAGGKLNLYTVDRLVTFFQRELSPNGTELRDRQRQVVNGFAASMDALHKAGEGELPGLADDERVRVLRTILVYQLCQVPTTLENIQFGLYCLSKAEKKQVEGRLKKLDRAGALFFRKQSKTYELAASGGPDVYDLIERYVGDPSLHPTDPVGAFLEAAGRRERLDFLDAKGYNLPFGEDKRFRMRFVRAKDIGPALWKEIRDERAAKRDRPKSAFEGTLVYALCEDDAEIDVAREAARAIPAPDVALAVPHEPQRFTETLLRVKACQHYLPPGEAERISAQAESRLRDLLESPDGYLPKLQRVLREILEGGDACWYVQDGKVLVDRPKQAHKPADMLCESLFTKRCRIKHADLNLVHDDKWRSGKNTALKQAVDVLLGAEQILIDNGNPDNHGQKRYLEKVLLRGAGALRRTGAEGTVTYFDCETDPAKIQDDFPVLRELARRLDGVNPGEDFPVGSFLDEARAAPWGVGGTPLILALAYIVRAYGERLIVYRDSTRMAEAPIGSWEDLVRIVSDPAAKAVFVVRDISPAHAALVAGIADAVGAPPLRHGETRSLAASYDALQAWWQGLPPVARLAALYPEDRRRRLRALIDVMGESSAGVDRFDFMLQRFPAAYTGDPTGGALAEADVDQVLTAFREDVALLGSGESIAIAQVAGALCPVFGTKGDLVECEKAAMAWYESLTPAQRDAHRTDHEDAAYLLTRLADPSATFQSWMLTDLPRDFGFGAVRDWTAVHAADYASKLKQAKAEIDKARPHVYPPSVDEGVHEIHERQKVLVPVPDGAAALIFTTDGEDPRGSECAERAEETVDLARLVEGRPSVRIVIRAVDAEGNLSDPRRLELVSRERKHEIQVTKDLFDEEEATFKCPDDTFGLFAVLKSVVGYGVRKKLLNRSAAERIERVLDDLVGDGLSRDE
jgi:hypothetical protein